MFVYLIIAFFAVLCLIHYVCNCSEKALLMRKLPTPKVRFVLGNSLDIIHSPSELFKYGRALAKANPGIYGIWAYPIGVVNIYNPEDIEKILSNSKYNHKSMIYSFLHPWLQNGLLVSNGNKWQERRKILTPAFHFNILKKFVETFEENSVQLAQNFRFDSNNKCTVDIVQLLSDYTLRSICETAMGTKLSEQSTNEGRSYKHSIHMLGKILVDRFTKIYLYLDFIFSLSSMGRAQKKHLDVVHGFTRKVINARKQEIKENGIDWIQNIENDEYFMTSYKKKIAMLDLLISAENDGLIDDKGIQEEVDTFMFEGHDTTSSGLIYLIMLLANHKDIQKKVVEELNNVFAGSSRRATMQELNKMKYLECCIKEACRLYPPVPFISRKIDEETVLSNYKIPAGAICHIHIFDLHRREDLFEDALEFKPERFLPENSVDRHPFSYIPFSAGPRNCIGQRFALLEMKSAISTILRRFELQPVTKPSDIRFISDLVLRSDAPIVVTFVKRH